MPRPLAMLCLPLSALALSACGTTVSVSGFKGEQHEVAQTIANFQTEATSGERKKICGEYLAAALVTRLGGTKGCEAAIKSQLSEVDSFETAVESVRLGSGGKTATARVKSVHEGKKAASTLTLVKEGDRWRISGV
jgi:Putative lumazine-binding